MIGLFQEKSWPTSLFAVRRYSAPRIQQLRLISATVSVIKNLSYSILNDSQFYKYARFRYNSPGFLILWAPDFQTSPPLIDVTRSDDFRFHRLHTMSPIVPRRSLYKCFAKERPKDILTWTNELFTRLSTPNRVFVRGKGKFMATA